MDILLYLSELLKQQNSIGVTGLGTFYKKKFAGRYDKEKQSFLPPGYTLEFTPEVKEEDLLVNYIAEKRNISKESAQYYISQFVEEINNKLEIEHEAELESVGRLFFTEHEGLSFEPAENIILGSKYYGLPKVTETQPVEDSPAEETKQNPTDNLKSEQEELNEDEQIYDEIAEAPTNHKEEIKTEQPLPEIENIELDEVRDDLKNTLANSTNVEEVEVPEFIKEQHEEHPNRFGHQPESEEPKTFINLEEDEVAEPVVQAPEFIKEQHAEHPNRFGHNPMIEDAVVEDEKSVWSKIWIGIIVLIILAGIAYFAKPEWFGSNVNNGTDSVIVAKDTTAKVIKVDSTKLKQDSITKTDSILKANQVEKTLDSTKKAQVVGVKPPSAVKNETATVVNNTANSTFDVIAASFQSQTKAKVFIKQMEKYGLKAKIANLPGKLKKVSIASFKTEAEARLQRPELAKKIKIKELDIIQVNNTP